ncbi:MAG: PTS sugar transporter subunit IIA [Fusobacteriaceae bacterium]|nr:PTS sugar transporter subunit IIA [Fusobacteriaceae bacterium]MBN2838961.1 PTS sugar transporter subunit IIA [Fusobacteriaceae bacterium]
MLRLRKELENNIQVVESVESWEKAIELASKPLLEKNKIEERYIESMINNINKLGPYVVLMPRIAMPHSRPESGVIESCMSLLKINSGVAFSSDKTKEKINIVFILGAKDNSSHIELITQLTELLEDEKKIEKIIMAEDESKILNLLN